MTGRNFFRSVFPTLWDNFDQLVADSEIVSVREVLREIEDGPEFVVNRAQRMAASGRFVSEAVVPLPPGPRP